MVAFFLALLFSDHPPAVARRRRALLAFFPVTIFLFACGLVRQPSDDGRYYYGSIQTRTPPALGQHTSAIDDNEEERLSVEDFLDIQQSKTPPISMRNNSNSSDCYYEDDAHYQRRNKLPVPYGFMLERHPNFDVSPYELRRQPGKNHLPDWAHKQKRTGQDTIPRGKHVCFVHVGKTGGSTLGCALGFSLHCKSFIFQRSSKMLRGVLPLYTTNVFHNNINDCPDRMPYYLLAVRNPLDRVQSAYAFDRPRTALLQFEKRDSHHENELYQDCPFQTLNQLALNGLAKDGNATGVCKARAVKTIRGAQRRGYHLYFNYRWFVTKIFLQNQRQQPANTTEMFFSSSKILAIRNRHMVDDWNAIERLLANNTSDATAEATTINFRRNNPTAPKTIQGDAVLSDTARQLLCHYLCDEIQLYKWLLYQAINLNEDDFVQSMKELRDTCPVEAAAKSCDPVVPEHDE